MIRAEIQLNELASEGRSAVHPCCAPVRRRRALMQDVAASHEDLERVLDRVEISVGGAKPHDHLVAVHVRRVRRLRLPPIVGEALPLRLNAPRALAQDLVQCEAGAVLPHGLVAQDGAEVGGRWQIRRWQR